MRGKNSNKHRKAEAEKAESAAAREHLHRVHAMQCPNCAACDTSLILYGLPAFDDRLNADLDSGLVVLGGCDLADGQPEFFCNACRHEWETG